MLRLFCFIQQNIKIGSPETLTIYGLGPILQDYRRLFPQVDIALVNDSNTPMYEKLHSGEIDMAFQVASDFNSKDYVVIHLADEKIVLVANTDCKINNLEVNLDQILNECVIYNAKGCIYIMAFPSNASLDRCYAENMGRLYAKRAAK